VVLVVGTDDGTAIVQSLAARTPALVLEQEVARGVLVLALL